MTNEDSRLPTCAHVDCANTLQTSSGLTDVFQRVDRTYCSFRCLDWAVRDMHATPDLPAPRESLVAQSQEFRLAFERLLTAIYQNIRTDIRRLVDKVFNRRPSK